MSPYIDSYTKLQFECENGHQFSLLPYDAKRLGKWCKECNKEPLRQEQYKRLQHIVKEHGGKLHSPRYINNTTHLEFECENQHSWKTSPSVIYKGHWCPFCARLRNTSSNNVS